MTHTFCLSSYLAQNLVRERLSACPPGRVLDAGSGRGPHHAVLIGNGCEVLRLDREERGAGVDLIGDVQAMPQVASESMDGVICTQVLEHVPRPWDAVAEMARVLRPGGWLVLSVPHLSVIHEAPLDFYRYTRYGLRFLLEREGFQEPRIDAAGGLLAFLAHPVSAVWLGLAAGVPGLRYPAWLLNYLLIVRLLAPIDRWFGLRSLYPCNYVVTARKRDAGPAQEVRTG